MSRRDYGGRSRHRISFEVNTKSNESIKRVGVTASAPSHEPSLIKVFANMARLDAAGLDLALIEPCHEVCNQSHRSPDGRCGVSLSLKLLGQHLSECRKRTIPRKPARLDETLSHDYPQLHHEAWLTMTLFRVIFQVKPRMQSALGLYSAYSLDRNSASACAWSRTWRCPRPWRRHARHG
jgi:hypothetical protein